MKTGRADLDALVKVSPIPADEPIFILRAQNRTAADTVRDWAERESADGSPIAVIEQGLQQADAMDKWPVKKRLNADHLSDAVAKQLVYENSRRIWNSGRIIAEAHALALEIAILDGLIHLHGRGPDFYCSLVEVIAKARELKAFRHG